MMEHQKGGHKSKARSYFQKATTFTITARPLSPGHDRAFSGPIAPLVPVEARRRTSRNSDRFFDMEHEPTSPKVGCMGQIKHKKAMHRLKSKQKKVNKNNKNDKSHDQLASSSRFSKFIKGKIKPTEKTAVVGGQERDRTDAQLAPPIGQMKRFASGRDAFRGFDWQVSDENHHGNDDEEVDLSISHSGPISFDSQRKEVNLWRRRTMVPPRPLHLN